MQSNAEKYSPNSFTCPFMPVLDVKLFEFSRPSDSGGPTGLVLKRIPAGAENKGIRRFMWIETSFGRNVPTLGTRRRGSGQGGGIRWLADTLVLRARKGGRGACLSKPQSKISVRPTAPIKRLKTFFFDRQGERRTLLAGT